MSTGSVPRLRKGAGSNFKGARSIPYAGSVTVMESATGILQGFSLRIYMNLSGVKLKLHTSHSNLQSIVYSSVPNTRPVLNKRPGGKFIQN